VRTALHLLFIFHIRFHLLLLFLPKLKVDPCPWYSVPPALYPMPLFSRNCTLLLGLDFEA
jgi:hypothetical protein